MKSLNCYIDLGIKKYHIFLFVLMASNLYSQNTNPVVSNVAFSILDTTVTVTYDVFDAEQAVVTIGMQVSSDNGATWNYNFGAASGDIGPGVPIGNNNTISWNYTGGFNPNFMIRIVANDEVPDGNSCGRLYYEGGPHIDSIGTYYNTIQIGTQCWMKESLNVGTMINGDSSQTNNGIIEKYCFGDLPASCAPLDSGGFGYGGLYQWNEAMQYVTTPGAQGICPSGWHIPTAEEFETLSNFIGGNGNELKALGVHSTTGNEGTNTSGFSALFGGFRNNDTIPSRWRAGDDSFYAWISLETDYDTAFADYRRLDFENSTFYWIHNWKTFGLSVRCIKD